MSNERKVATKQERLLFERMIQNDMQQPPQRQHQPPMNQNRACPTPQQNIPIPTPQQQYQPQPYQQPNNPQPNQRQPKVHKERLFPMKRNFGKRDAIWEEKRRVKMNTYNAIVQELNNQEEQERMKIESQKANTAGMNSNSISGYGRPIGFNQSEGGYKDPRTVVTPMQGQPRMTNQQRVTPLNNNNARATPMNQQYQQQPPQPQYRGGYPSQQQQMQNQQNYGMYPQQQGRLTPAPAPTPTPPLPYRSVNNNNNMNNGGRPTPYQQQQRTPFQKYPPPQYSNTNPNISSTPLQQQQSPYMQRQTPYQQQQQYQPQPTPYGRTPYNNQMQSQIRTPYGQPQQQGQMQNPRSPFTNSSQLYNNNQGNNNYANINTANFTLNRPPSRPFGNVSFKGVQNGGMPTPQQNNYYMNSPNTMPNNRQQYYY